MKNKVIAIMLFILAGLILLTYPNFPLFILIVLSGIFLLLSEKKKGFKIACIILNSIVCVICCTNIVSTFTVSTTYEFIVPQIFNLYTNIIGVNVPFHTGLFVFALKPMFKFMAMIPTAILLIMIGLLSSYAKNTFSKVVNIITIVVSALLICVQVFIAVTTIVDLTRFFYPNAYILSTYEIVAFTIPTIFSFAYFGIAIVYLVYTIIFSIFNKKRLNQ